MGDILQSSHKYPLLVLAYHSYYLASMKQRYHWTLTEIKPFINMQCFGVNLEGLDRGRNFCLSEWSAMHVETKDFAFSRPSPNYNFGIFLNFFFNCKYYSRQQLQGLTGSTKSDIW